MPVRGAVVVTSLVIAGTAIAPRAFAADPTKQECVDANEKGQSLRQRESRAEARAQFVVCLASSCPEPVREDCADRIAEIERSEPAAVVIADDGGGMQRNAGIGVAGLGAAGLIVGGVLGLVAKSTYDDALKEDCGGDARRCTAAGVSQVGTAHDQATVSTVGFIAGSALVAGGVILWATARRDLHVTPVVGGGTLMLGGTF
jgi:hypothetical protein